MENLLFLGVPILKHIRVQGGVKNSGKLLDGRTAPRTVAMDTFRRGSGGTSLGEWEHNNNKSKIVYTSKTAFS